MNAQEITNHLRIFLERAKRYPYRTDRIVPAARNLLRIAQLVEKEEGENEELESAINDVKDWFKIKGVDL